MQDTLSSPTDFSLEATRPAGFWIRVAAYAIDFLIMMVPAIAALFMKSAMAYILLMIPVILYKPVLEGLLGGTAGKLAIGLRVINAEGEKLGLAGGLVRNGLFILPVIPSMLLQLKMIEAGISPFDPEAAMTFQASHELLYLAYYALSILLLASCVMVAFTRRKRGLHDLVADSYVIQPAKEAQ